MTDSVETQAKAAYKTFVRRAASSALTFEEFCEEHPDLVDELKILHAEWQAANAASNPTVVTDNHQGPDAAEAATINQSADEAPTIAQPSGAQASDDVSNPTINLQSGTGATRSALDKTALAAGMPPSADEARYVIRGEIARGGMGAIYKVWDADLRREVAMKVVLDAPHQDPTATRVAVTRFMEEAQITGQLEHPCVASVHELGGDADGKPFFTMNLVRGRDFKTIIDLCREEKENWSQGRGLGVILKVCEALAYAHQQKVIHRDLKPANIMVGGFGEVYIMDWGLAKVLGKDDTRNLQLRTDASVSLQSVHTDRADAAEVSPDSPIMTQCGAVIGTPSYMPPEQAEGRIDDVGPLADIYSVGAMLYTLLTGHMPYVKPGVAISPRTVLAAVIDHPPTPIHEIDKHVHVELVAICEKAMARDPEDRYHDVMEMALDIRAYIDHKVVKAYQTGAIAEFKKWVVRNKGMAASLLLAVFLAIAGAVAVAVERDRAATEQANLNTQIQNKNTEITRQNTIITQERDAAREIGEFMEGLFEVPDPSESRGNSLTARAVLDKGRKDIEARLADQPVTQARLLNTMGRVYGNLGLYDVAQELLVSSLEKRVEHLGTDDAEVAETRSDLSQIYMHQRDYDEAEELARKSLLSRRENYEGDHEAVAESLNWLGWILENQKKHEEALKHLTAALEMRQRLYGNEDHELIAESLYRLGWAYNQTGDTEKAEPLLRQALDMRRSTLGDDHYDVATSLSTLVQVLIRKREYSEAELKIEEALKIYRLVLTDKHAHVANALNVQGQLRWWQKRYDDALPCFEEACTIYEAVHGEKNPDYASSLHNTGILYYQKRDLEEASRRLAKALEIRLELLPEDHDQVILSRKALGRTLMGLRKYDEAEPVINALHQSYRKKDEKSQETARAASDLGVCLREVGLHARAEGYLLDAYRILKEVTGPRTTHTRRTLERIVVLYEKWEKPEKAAEYMKILEAPPG